VSAEPGSLIPNFGAGFRKVREGERMNEGMDPAEVLRHLEITESTWNRWRNQYGGMAVNRWRRQRRGGMKA
jgi:hypothetical protein